MKNKIFSAKNIDSLPIPNKNSKVGYILYKHEQDKSIALKVTTKNTKTFIIVFPDGKRKSIGKYPEVSITNAKDISQEMRLARKRCLEGGSIIENTIEIPTFLQMSVKYLEWSKKHKKETTIKSDKNRLTNHVFPILANKKVTSITNRDISALLNNIKNRDNNYTYLKSFKDVKVKDITQLDFISYLKELGYDDEITHNILDIGADKLYQTLLFYIKNKSIVDNYFNKHSEMFTVVKQSGQGTANRVKATISHMFNTAMTWNEPEWECVISNPCVGVKSTQSKSKTRYLDKVELKSLYQVLTNENEKGNKTANIINFLLLTGSRKSEVTSAKSEHIDFNKKMWIRPDNNSKTKLAPPVPLSNSAINLLESMYKHDKTGYIFKSDKDSSKHVGEFRKSFQTILKKAGIENCTPHDLRRTFGTQLLLAGVDIYTVSKLLGHNSVSTTERHYAFLNRETLHTAVNALDDIMS